VLCVLENVLLVIPVGSLLLITYVVTVRQEELFLSEKFREAYAAYARDVPRILPAFRKYRRDTREHVEMNIRLLLRGIGDAAFALLVPPAALLVEHFHASGVLPIWFHV